MDGTRFVNYLATWRPQVDAWIEAHAWSPLPSEATAAADMRTYLYDPLARYNANAGKRTRPVLALLGCEAVGGRPQDALSVGCAVELFQSAALIHDDIADEGTLRRGEPCLHRTQGTGLAINVGDAALVQTSDAILGDESLPEAVQLRILRLLVDMERHTLEGQALDLGWARDGRWDVSVADYLTMAAHKTAFYSAAVPLQLGAIVGGGTPEQVEALGAFGMKAGMAFQLEDDLLNLVGDAREQGKDRLTDITEGKRTLPVLYALAHLEEPEREALLAAVSSGTDDEDDLLAAVSLMDAAGALDFARSYARDTVAAAIAELDSVKLDPDARATLVSMAHFFVERAS